MRSVARTSLRLSFAAWLLMPVGTALSDSEGRVSDDGTKPVYDTSETYDPAGRRDPFQSPFRTAVEPRPVEKDAPALQRYALGQFTLVGVIWGAPTPAALVRSPDGRGHIVKAGARIGTHGGTVRTIEPRQIVVEEYPTDWYGNRLPRTRAISLAAEGAP